MTVCLLERLRTLGPIPSADLLDPDYKSYLESLKAPAAKTVLEPTCGSTCDTSMLILKYLLLRQPLLPS